MSKTATSAASAKPALSDRELRLQAALKRNMARRKEAARRPAEPSESHAQPQRTSHE